MACRLQFQDLPWGFLPFGAAVEDGLAQGILSERSESKDVFGTLRRLMVKWRLNGIDTSDALIEIFDRKFHTEIPMNKSNRSILSHPQY